MSEYSKCHLKNYYSPPETALEEDETLPGGGTRISSREKDEEGIAQEDLKRTGGRSPKDSSRLSLVTPPPYCTKLGQIFLLAAT